MDGDKKKRSLSRRSGRLSLTQGGDSGEENPPRVENICHNKSSKAVKNAGGNVSHQEIFKSPTRNEICESTSRIGENVQKQSNLISPMKDFCPICQVPLPFIKIPVELHTAHCLIEADVLPVCPDGIACVSNNMFHYRDYNHNELAVWRCSADYVPPDYNYALPKSTKKRPSLSPLSLASRTKKIKTPDSERVDDPCVLPGPAVARKALFVEEVKPHGISLPNEKPLQALKKVKHEPNDYDDARNESFLSDPLEKNVTPKTEVKPLKCDVRFEYNADEASSKTSIAGKQSACSVACLSSSSGDELQAVCTVRIKALSGKPQEAAAKSPVHVNLLLNETGWEAVQVDGSASASVKQVDISLCKCARAMTVNCFLSDPKITSNNSEVKIEHKCSVLLDELGLKNKTQAWTGETAAEKVDSLKNKNAQLSIKSFFKSEKDDKPDEFSKVLVQTNGEREPKKFLSAKPSCPKTPIILLAGSSSRPPTAIALEGEASKVLRSTSTTEYTKPRRAWGKSSTPVPQYKRIPGTPFVVDAFKWGSIDGIKAYFLSHFHSDHYIGLKKHFNEPIYCSRITAKLIRLKFGVNPQFLHVLEIGEPRVLCNVEVEVFDANHCPGSLMFLFRLLDGRCILHVGDFRASTSMEEIRCLKQVDFLFLDTTYCDPAYDFPPQGEIVKEVVRVAKIHLQQNPKTLFCCGSYTIGKEKVFISIAEALDCNLFTNKEKAKVLNCLGDNIIQKRLVNDPSQAQIHVVYMRDINFQHLDTILKEAGSCYTSLVAFEPTGWTTSKVGSPSTLKRTSKGRITIYSVPYSEHSSFTELKRFVRFVRPKQIQVTVNLGKQRLYKKYFKDWLESSGGEQASLDAFLNK